MKNKPSELFEGPNSSLHKAYVKVIERKSKEKRPIDLYDNPYQNEVWEAENEVIITKEKPIDKIDSNLDMFLGKDNLLKQVFRQLIENKTIELNC